MSNRVLRAISIREPWVWAIRCGGKQVENRSRDSLISYRGPVLLHTGQTCSRTEFAEAIAWMMEQGLVQSPTRKVSVQMGKPLPRPPVRVSDLALGGFGARAVVVGCRRNDPDGHVWGPEGCRGCGATRRTANECPKPDRWAAPGAVGILLDHVEPLPCFVPWKGNLGLPFNVSEDEFALVLAAHLVRRSLDLEELTALSSPYRAPGPILSSTLDVLLDRGDLVDDGGRLRPPSYRSAAPIYDAPT